MVELKLDSRRRVVMSKREMRAGPGIGFEARRMWCESIFEIMTERRPHVLSTSSI